MTHTSFEKRTSAFGRTVTDLARRARRLGTRSPLAAAALFIAAAMLTIGISAQAQSFNQTLISSIFGAFTPFTEMSTPAVISDDKKDTGTTSDLNLAVQYSQGFETDGVWSPTSTVTRVASGTNGVTSKTGGFHGEVGTNSTQWGGYNSTFPALGYVTSVDIYLNVAGGYANDSRFDWDSAVSNSSGGFLRDFVFNAGFYTDGTGPGAGVPRFVVSGSNNATSSGAFPKNPARNPVAITASGWYTFKHRFYNDGTGKLAVEMTIVNSSSAVVGTWTLSDPTDVIGSTVGGNRYGWFVVNAIPSLAIDNSQRANVAPPTVVTVRPEALNGWTVNTELGAAADFISDATAPGGFGALRLTSPADPSASAYLAKDVDVPLAGITDMGYSTKQIAGGAPADPSYVFQVYLDGTASTATYMFYEPYWNGTVQTGTWQHWDVAAGTQLWSSSTRNAGGSCQVTAGGGGPPFYTLAGLKAACPNAVVKGIFVNIGSGNPNYDVETDLFSFNDTVYDFEPTAIKVVDLDGKASATDCNDTATIATTSIGAAVSAANPGDTIRVCPATYPNAATINLNKAGLTIVGVGAAKPVVRTPVAPNRLFFVSADNVTLDNLEIQKTDPHSTSEHNLINVQANNFTAKNNLIYGPNPGGPWLSTGNYYSRAFAISASTGLLLQNNTIHSLRQPAYMSGSATSGGTITGNNVSGTKGWVVEGGNFAFSGNTWGEPQNQDCDIALLGTLAPANVAFYQPLLTLSSTNDNAYICGQYTGAESGRAVAYVDSPIPSLGNGSDNSNYTTIQEGINGALAGGTVQVAAGTYNEQIDINKKLNVLGPNASIDPNTGARVTEAVLHPTVNDPSYATGTQMVVISADEVVFKGFTVDGDNPSLAGGVNYNGADVNAGIGIINTGNANPRATITNNIVKNIGEMGLLFYGTASGGAANSTITANKFDNIPGQLFGQGIHIRTNAYANVNNNVLTRVGFGIVTEDFFAPGAAPATISNNTISAHIYGIRQNAHYGSATSGFTISNNTIGSYVESFVRPTPVTRYNGIRIESIQNSVPVNVTGNTITPDRTALVGNGYSRVDGIFITNTSTTSPNIVISGNTVSNALRGISHTTPAVPTVTCNLLINNDTGIYVGTDIGFGGTPSSSTNGIIVHDNNILSNSTWGLQNESSFVTDATNNYWGSVSGPGGAGAGTGNPVSSNVNFTPFLTAASSCAALPAAVSISGVITPATAGITVTLSGDASATTTTDGAGNYSFTGLTSGGNYLVTPTFAGSNFDPTNRSYSTVTSSITNANFTRFTGGSPRVISVVSQNVIPGQQVVVPITVLSQGNENSFGFSVNYDPAYLSSPVVSLGTDCAGCSLTVNPTGSTIGIVLAKPSGQTLPASPPARQLVKVTFNTTSTPASFSTPVTFGDLPVSRVVGDTNADPLPASYSSGNVTFATGFESDVAPRFTGSNTGLINALDYGQMARFAAGLDTTNPLYNEFQRADAAPRASRGNGAINTLDYGQAGRYAAGLDTVQSSGGPTVASLFDGAAVTKKYATESFVAGSVRTVKAADISTHRGSQVIVSVEIESQGDENVLGFTLSYDQAALVNPTVALGTGMAGGNLTPNTNTAGRVGVVLGLPAGTVLSAGTRQLVTITFDVKNTAPFGQTPLTMVSYPPVENIIGDVTANELPGVFATGYVNILSPTAANVPVMGQVTNGAGQGIARARVSLNDGQGNVWTASTNGFGYYRFEDVPAGVTFVASVEAKNYRFEPISFTLGDELVDLDFIAEK